MCGADTFKECGVISWNERVTSDEYALILTNILCT